MATDLDLDDVASQSDRAKRELKELRDSLESAINAADKAIEIARAVDGRERDALRATLMLACNGLAVGLVLAQQRPGSDDQMALLSDILGQCQGALVTPNLGGEA